MDPSPKHPVRHSKPGDGTVAMVYLNHPNCAICQLPVPSALSPASLIYHDGSVNPIADWQ
jgi:hypothetical protein